MPFVLTPQVWKPPALTDVKVPPGGVAWPAVSLPPAGDGAVRPHGAGVLLAGAHRVKVPAGGVDLPKCCEPQQARVPSVRTPQL